MSEKRKSIFTNKSSAGKGDSPRRSISIDEWGTKWEKIFRKKKKFVRPHKTDNSGSKS
tara:strand:+ start:400 stop:573 length:174 start_codon:yes stop_codon:yes gene_type:complete